MDKKQLRELIVETLKEIDLYSEDAVNLMMGTAAQESRLGEFIRQLFGGPALGIFQMEPNTFRDICKNYLVYKKDLWDKIINICNSPFVSPDMLVWNLKLAICMTRVHYLRVPEKLPNSIEGYANYYKKYYNTYLGKATTEEFIHNYKKYVL